MTAATPRRRTVLTLSAAAVLVVVCAAPTVGNRNSASRFLAAAALAERGTFAITADPAVRAVTGDLVVRDGTLRSSKPPLLSVAMAGVYAALRPIGLSLPPLTPDYTRVPSAAVWLLTVVFSGLPFLATVWLILRVADRAGVEDRWRSLLAAAAAGGTLLTTYAVTLNNHVPAAALLFAAWYQIFALRHGGPDGRRTTRLIAAGTLLGLGVAVEPVPGLILVPLLAAYAWRTAGGRIMGGAFLPPVLAGIGLHLVLSWWAFGSFLPPQLDPAGYGPDGLALVRQPVLRYTGNILLGTHGVFSYSPFLLLGLIPLWRAARDHRYRFKAEAVVIGAAMFILLFFYAAFIRDFGGGAFGFRWALAYAPLLAALAVVSFAEPVGPRRHGIALAVITASVAVALLGCLNPWPRHIEVAAGLVRSFPLLVNLHAAVSYAEGDAATPFAAGTAVRLLTRP